MSEYDGFLKAYGVFFCVKTICSLIKKSAEYIYAKPVDEVSFTNKRQTQM